MTVSSDPGSAPRNSSAYLAHTLEEIPAADGAQMLAQLAPDEAAKVAEYLDPKTASAVDLMCEAPASVEQEQLDDLGLEIKRD